MPAKAGKGDRPDGPVNSLKNPVFQRERAKRKFAHCAHEFSDRQVFIFFRTRQRFLPENAALTYTPPNLIENG
ncbi:MAG: hypothetical protein IJI26_13795, partial [Clostridia bacterium]|nr:hypothetical protein [Clostridia bacterium]